MDGELFNDIKVDESSWTIRGLAWNLILPIADDQEDDILTIELEKLSYVLHTHTEY
jgi:hypothetical protein